MISREEGLELLKEHIGRENVFKHSLAVEAIMKELANYLEEDTTLWAMTGLLHDVDYTNTEDTPEKHGLVSEEILKEKFPEEAIHAIKAHNFKHTGVEPQSDLDYALIAADALSGLIIATALIRPSQKLEDVEVRSINKKFKDSSFAKGCSRGKMMYCKEIGIEKDKFFHLALRALQKIDEKLGL